LKAKSLQEERDWKILMDVFNLLVDRGRRIRMEKEKANNTLIEVGVPENDFDYLI
jgi:hypothetical protein